MIYKDYKLVYLLHNKKNQDLYFRIKEIRNNK
jgi:hypothetical protein